MTDCGPLTAQDIERYLIIYLFLSPLSTELDKYAWIFYTIGRTRLAVTISNYVSGITKPLFKKTEPREDVEKGSRHIDELKQMMVELQYRVQALEAENSKDRIEKDRVADKSREQRVKRDVDLIEGMLNAEENGNINREVIRIVERMKEHLKVDPDQATY
uniref:Uncharacterized protein n=1 Tax=Acrobeloides nanus TaxID=290746 RepID=A0A914E661_9BILA